MAILRKSFEIITQEGISSLFYKIILWKKNRYFIKLMSQKQWDKAARVGEKLVHILPKKIEFYQGLARCYKKLGKDDLATSTMLHGLEFLISPNEIQNKLYGNLNSAFCPEFSYFYLGGEQNLGCIRHAQFVDGKVEKYLTKISTKSKLANDKLFYLRIYNLYPEIMKITPRLVNFVELENEKLVLITMEEIVGTEPIINEMTIKDILKANQLISSIKYGQIKDYVINPGFDKEFQLFYKNDPKHPINALHSFVSIHKKTTNQQLFHLIYQRMKDLRYSSDSLELIKQLEKIIFDFQLFNKLDIELHYSLQHGDFSENNMLIERESGKLYIIDWGNMMIGPTWMDIAGFFGQLRLPFEKINKDYLLNQEASNHLEQIEKVFFIYTLIITWFVIFSQSEFDKKLDLYVRPAVEVIKSMVSNFENN